MCASLGEMAFVLAGYKVEEWNIEIESSPNGMDGATREYDIIGSLSQHSPAKPFKVEYGVFHMYTCTFVLLNGGGRRRLLGKQLSSRIREPIIMCYSHTHTT